MQRQPNIGQSRIIRPRSAAVLGLALLLSLCAARAPAQDAAAPGESDDSVRPRCLGERTLARARASDAQWTAFRSSNVVVPPLLWLSSDRSFAMAAMLYWHSASIARGTDLHLFAPLLFYRCTPDHRGFGGPLFAYRRDAEGLAGFAGLYFFRRDREARTDALFPLMLHSLDHGRRTLTLLNGYWHRTARGYHAGFIPLLFWGRAGEYRYGGVLPPLVWFGRDRENSTNMVLPFYLRRDARGRTRTGVLPLYFRVRSHAYAHDVLFPLFWRYRGANWRAGLIGQSYWLKDPNVHTFGSFPFYMGRRDRDGRYLDIALPALFARAGKGGHKFIWALNTLWSKEQSGDYELDVIPLFVAKRKGSARSLYSWLALRSADEQSTTTVIPPLLLGWGSRPDGRWLLVGPAFLRRRQRDWRGGLLPLYWGNHDRTRYADTIPALLFSRWGGGARAGWMLGPVYRRVDAGLSAWGVAPLFAQRREGDALFRMFTPLVLRSKTASERTTGVFPLAWHRRNDDLRRFVSPLVFHYARESSRTRRTTLFPLFWYRASPERTSDVFAPFWWHFERRDEGRRLSLLFPLGFRRDTPEERTWLALNTVYTRGAGSNAGAWSFHFFPLLSLSRFRADHFKWQVLMGMLGHEHDAQRSRWRALWIWTDPA